MFRHRVTAIALFSLTLACPNKGDGPSGSSSTSAASATKPTTSTTATPSTTAATPSATASTSTTTTTAASDHAIDGVGAVPAWSADKGGASKCKAKDAARIKTLDKGEDDALSAGTADVDKLIADVAGDCRSAKNQLATALNDGGYKQYTKKKYVEADRWWRAALVARPGHILARYNLACGLVLGGKPKDGIWALSELARAAADGDAHAANMLEKAKSDDDLKSVRDDAGFKEAVKASQGGLVGPRKEPETATEAAKLLPDDFRKVPAPQDWPGGEKTITYKPAILNVWTWRPDDKTELLVATIIDDPAKLGKPKGDINMDYGGIGVFRREGGKLTLLLAKKTGESYPNGVASSPGGGVAYSFDEPCGTLRGVLKWESGHVVVKEKSCQDL